MSESSGCLANQPPRLRRCATGSICRRRPTLLYPASHEWDLLLAQAGCHLLVLNLHHHSAILYCSSYGNCTDRIWKGLMNEPGNFNRSLRVLHSNRASHAASRLASLSGTRLPKPGRGRPRPGPAGRRRCGAFNASASSSHCERQWPGASS